MLLSAQDRLIVAIKPYLDSILNAGSRGNDAGSMRGAVSLPGEKRRKTCILAITIGYRLKLIAAPAALVQTALGRYVSPHNNLYDAVIRATPPCS